MKILLITTSFNGMSQRAWVELDRFNHQVKVHIATTQENMLNAVSNYQPELIIAPYLKTVIPDAIWKNYTCLIIHPGIIGDRGSASLDWAILNNETEWGVSVLQATQKMDAGPIWSTATFLMRNVSKSFLYRHEVTQAAMKALLEAVQKFEEKKFVPQSREEIDISHKGKWNRSTNENDFRFSWNEDTAAIMRKINAADSFPGAMCTINDNEYLAFGAFEERILKGSPGSILGTLDSAVCIATINSAVWIQCLKNREANSIKLPAAIVLANFEKYIPDFMVNTFDYKINSDFFSEIKYHEENEVGYLSFDFYNGAMSTDQCVRLKNAFAKAKQRNTKVIVLLGGQDIWSNGIHLNLIEASENPAETSWENINAMDDLIHEIICTDTHYIISALQGNAGAGGVSLALAADKVLAKEGIVFNPHTRNMGLYGSEYWTYLLPRRIGDKRAKLFTEQCLPWGTDIALEVKLIDGCLNEDDESFRNKVKNIAEEIAHLSYFSQLLTAKKFKRKRDESYKPLQQYREEELKIMRKNFFEDDWGYDYKRYCFVHKINVEEKANSIADKDLFSERRKIWRRRKYEKLFYEA
ncbi:hydrogenase maturation protein [Ginsengibacter hankyongi]|uniref:Hydrogenase maturation protein n=1 Tax=Ginsengibacter hankyongi TaxID=2607284 RepID=A0A5J5IH62_9BACT|nr:enoyl-CoA hydratase-related protein [Ginsengibacter hankyongi]KAA9038586.1 hydrogenase maturation protein [Ginsengibacter hankyongi]